MQLRRTVLPLVATAALLTALAAPASAATGGKLKDSDRDGLPDRWEISHHLNPRNAKDAKKDTDKDGVPNRLEFKLGGNPRSADTDKDGVPDGIEVQHRTKLDKPDSDGDGISDGDSDANGDGICDRDQRAAFGVVAGYDSETGTLTVTTKAGATKTFTLTDDTRIDQRNTNGWRHRPDRDPADEPPVTDEPGDDNGSDGPDVVFGDGSDPVADNDAAAGGADGDGDFTSGDDESGDPTDGPTAVEPENVELLEGGAVVLQIKVEDGVVERIRLA